MRYKTAEAFRAALERRLSSIAEESGIPLIRLRKLVVFDRLMARLLVAAPGRWILKGAVALHFRVGPQFRTTRDLDLGRRDDEKSATEDFLSAQAVNVGDYFTFAIERKARLDPAMQGAAVRYHAAASVAGRTFEDVTVDVGFEDIFSTDPEVVHGPDLLAFAGIPAVEVPALPIEQHAAEKVHAYTRRYARGNSSTRVKDLIDLAVMESRFTFLAGRLIQALEATFDSRGTHAIPVELPPPPPDWRIPYRRLANEVGLDAEVSTGYESAKVFLNPVLEGQVPAEAKWNPAKHKWIVGG